MSIQVGLGGFSFCILNTTREEITALEHIYFKDLSSTDALLERVMHIFQEKEVLSQPFHTVSVSHVNDLNTFVPRAFFTEGSFTDYLKYNIRILETDYITYDKIPNANIINTYVPYVNLNNFFFDRFGEFHYTHFASVLVENVLAQSANKDGSILYVNMRISHFEVIVVKNKKLVLYNDHKIDTEEDYIYYLLFTLEQLGLNPETAPLVLLGAIDKGDPYHSITYEYVRDVSFGKRNSSWRFTNDLEPKLPYTHYTLLSSL